MKIENVTTQALKLYNYLEKNAIGFQNRKSRNEIAEFLECKPDDVQKLVQEIRVKQLGKYISSQSGKNGGIWIQCEDEQKHNSLKSRCMSSIESAMLNNDITLEEVISFAVSVSKRQNKAVDGQIKIPFGEYESVIVKRMIHYEDMTKDMLYDKLKELDPYFPIARISMTKEMIIKEIKEIQDYEQKRSKSA